MIKEVCFLSILLFFSFSYSMNVQDYVEKGIKYLDEERYFDAIGEFRNAIEINPYYAKAHLYLGIVYFKLKDYSTSLEHGLNALKYANNDLSTLLIVANSYRELGEYKKAEELYKKILKNFPTDVDSLISVAEYYMRVNKLSMAYDYLSRAERIDKNSYRVAISFGEYYSRKQNFQKAEEYYKKAFNLNPYDRNVFTELAKFYIDQKRINDAVRILESGEKLFENFYNGVSLLSECYIKLGKSDKNFYKKAIEKLEWLISNTKKIDDRNLAFLYYKLALASEDINQDKAIENYEKAIKLYHDNELFRYSYENYVIKNLPVDSDIRKNLSDYHFNKASSLKSEGFLNLYFFHLKRAITTYPFFIKARYELIDYYESKSDFYNAYEELNRLLKIDNSYRIKDKIEKYEWRLKKEKSFDRVEFLPYRGTVLIDSDYYNYDKVFSDIFSYFFQYIDKFKFSTLEFRKNQGINYILEHLNANNENFFLLVKVESSSLIGFYVYDRTGKLLDSFFVNFNEGEIAKTIVSFYNWFNNVFPSVWKLEKYYRNEYKLKAGYYEKLKENDELTTFDIVNMNIKFKGKLEVKNVNPYSSIAVVKEDKNKKAETIGEYGVKTEFLTEKYLTKWKRALGY